MIPYPLILIVNILYNALIGYKCVAYCPKGAFDYTISPEMKEKYNYSLLKIMKLPGKRKRYHNPFVSAADISADRRHIK